MADWTYEVSVEHNIYPNITVYDRLRDGAPFGWRFNANDGYVMYDTSANNTERDDEGNEVPVTYYYTVYTASPRYNWDNFHWVAVPRSEVDENYIFGGPSDDNHEVM